VLTGLDRNGWPGSWVVSVVACLVKMRDISWAYRILTIIRE
jgi:hypothetical protein